MYCYSADVQGMPANSLYVAFFFFNRKHHQLMNRINLVSVYTPRAFITINFLLVINVFVCDFNYYILYTILPANNQP